MSGRTKEILGDTLSLPAIERALLVQELLFSIDQPDPQIDALWAMEAEDRLAAYEAVEITVFPAEDVRGSAERA